MENLDFLGFSKVQITGVKNPILHAEGTIEKDNCKFIILVDGKEKEYNVQIFPSTRSFVLDCNLTAKDKIIEIKLKQGKKIYNVYTLKNKMKSRLNNKFRSLIYKPLNSLKVIFSVLGRGIKYMWTQYHFLVPPKLWKKYIKEFFERVKYKDLNLYYNPFNIDEYNKWLKENEKEISEYEKFKYNPLISILIPVYNIGREFLSDCINSILCQSYENFEVCLVDDCSTNKETIETLEEFKEKDKRIKVKYRKENGHISRATNDALKMAKGEFVALVDNDDILPKDALYEMVKVLNKDKTIDMIYSDEDKINVEGKRCDPNFKSDFAPDSLLSSNYICHFTMLRKSIMDEIGGERVGYEGAQDYDLFLRFTEKTNKIYHIPKILYHWRMVPGSTSMVIDNKGYALERGKKALEDALERRNIKGKVRIDEKCPYYCIDYDVIGNPKVTIIIPTKDHADITEKCLESIYEKTTYKNYEVVVMNNNSEKKETFDLFDRYKKLYKNFSIIDANFEFNYSKINNIAVKKTKSDFILLLNNDIEVITPNWLEEMIGYASQKHIGAVGAKLIYPDETVQHAGVILGMGGVAAHAFANYDRNAIVWGGRLSVPYDYGAVTAACLMIDRKKYEEVGGLEETLQVAFNDVDFNMKLLQKGYYNVILPQVELYHYESKSRGLDNTTEKYKRFVSETNFMTEKWTNELKNDPFYNPNYSLRKNYMLDKK